MNTLKPVRLTKAWQQWRKGHVFSAMPAAQAQMMVRGGLGEYVVTEEKKSALNAPADRSMRSTQMQLKNRR